MLLKENAFLTNFSVYFRKHFCIYIVSQHHENGIIINIYKIWNHNFSLFRFRSSQHIIIIPPIWSSSMFTYVFLIWFCYGWEIILYLNVIFHLSHSSSMCGVSEVHFWMLLFQFLSKKNFDFLTFQSIYFNNFNVIFNNFNQKIFQQNFDMIFNIPYIFTDFFLSLVLTLTGVCELFRI